MTNAPRGTKTKKQRRFAPADNDDVVDDRITLRVREVVVAQEDGTWPPFAVVQSSVRVSREPRATDEARALERALRLFRPDIQPARPGFKFCASCAQWVSVRGFDKDASRRDGLHPYCKQCRREHERRMYEAAQARAGKKPRRYRRRSE